MKYRIYLVSACFACLFNFTALAVPAKLALNDAVRQAIQNDPWLNGNRLEQHAMEARSHAVDTLPNPVMSLSVMNVPTDTFALNQEAMTQLKVSVAQMFPRGDTVALQKQKWAINATRFPVLREDRKARIALEVSNRWLDWYQAHTTHQLIAADTHLFEQLLDVARAGYASAAGSTQQQDVIRAQLELLQLHDRLTAQMQARETALAALSEWAEVDAGSQPVAGIKDTQLVAFNEAVASDTSALAARLARHPQVRVIDVSRHVAEQDVALAKEQRKPQWGVNASYAYRENSALGNSRADFLSVGVSVDLPFFNAESLDSGVSAAIAQSQAVETQKRVLLKNMIAQVRKEQQTLNALYQRHALYNDSLIAQTREQAETSLTAYTNDSGDFSEVVRARIAQLNARIAALEIDVSIARAKAMLNYYFAGTEMAGSTEKQNDNK